MKLPDGMTVHETRTDAKAGVVTFTVSIDVGAITAAFEQARKTFEAFGVAMARAGEQIRTALRGVLGVSPLERATHVVRFGPDNVAESGEWITDMCAAWLHECCPSHHCDCRCHR